MNSAAFSNLPRFDASGDRRPADWLNVPLSEDAEIPVPLNRTVEKPVAAVPEKAAPSLPVPIAPAGLPAIEATLAALEQTMVRLEQESRDQSVRMMRTLAERLFPELSRQFLAEEIGRHLPALIPVSAPLVEIRAEPDLAGKLQEMIDRSVGLSGRCTVIPTQGREPGRADISWRTGGVSFDFGGLLETCLSRLNSTRSVNME